MAVSGDPAPWPGVQSVAERERLLLAPYAMHGADSRGRKHPEPAHPYRGPFQRDRDRIVHSSAFRRLSDKTQVFTAQGDYHRTRLTHTHEVASLARTIGRSLRLNEDLIEALALVHDIGHPPFGHAGEDALNECLSADGGFSHNQYALTIVEELERRYETFPGLNLSYEVLDGQLARTQKHAVDRPAPLLEAQVVDAADSITYDAHDIDDALVMGLVSLDELLEIPLLAICAERVRTARGALAGGILRRALVHELLDYQVSGVLRRAAAHLGASPPESAAAARRQSFRVGADAELAAQKGELEEFLYRRVYRHPDLANIRRNAQRQLERMFAGYVANPSLLPARFQERSATVGLRRAVGDYLAGMTDRYCQQQYSRHFGDSGGG